METETVIPFGFGAKFKLDSKFEINFENIWAAANTDNIDVTIGGFKYDILTYTSLGLTYKFNKSEKKKKIIFEEPTVVELKQEPKEVIKEEHKVIEPTIKEEPKIVEQPLIPKPKVVEKPIFPAYEFKVQVFASYYKANTCFIKKYNITEPVREDYNGVLYRYSVGSFKTYAEAKAKAKKLIAENKAYGAFVVGIKGDKRLDSFKELLSDEEKAALKVLPEKK